MPKISSAEDVAKGAKGESPFLEMEEGRNEFRIVSEIYGVKEHEIRKGNEYSTVICPIAMERWDAESEGREPEEKKCPMCESGDRSIKTSFVAIAIGKKSRVGVLKKGKTVFSPIAAMKEEGVNLLETSVVITAEGEGLNRKYTSVLPALKSTRPLTDVEQDAVLAFEKDFVITERTKPMSYENIQRKMRGEKLEFNDDEA